MSVTANAIFQLFLRASASAAAASFLAFSRLMGAPYGFGICASALDAHSANNMASRDFRIVCDMVLLLCLATVVKPRLYANRCGIDLIPRPQRSDARVGDLFVQDGDDHVPLVLAGLGLAGGTDFLAVFQVQAGFGFHFFRSGSVFQCASNLLQRRWILDSGEISRVPPFRERLDRAPQSLARAGLGQQGHEVYRTRPGDGSQLLVDA